MNGRRVVVHGMDLWAARLAAFTRRYGFAIADLDIDGAIRAAIMIATRSAPAAYRDGAALVEQAARAAGAAPAVLTKVTPPDVPDTIRRDLHRGWRAAEHAHDARIARARTAEMVIRQANLLAWRQGSNDQVTDNPEIVGYRRVADAGACAVCLALDTGEAVDASEPFDTHPNCGCGVEPVTSTTPPPDTTGQDRFDRMTATEQDQLFYGRGGQEMADLVRSGQVGLADLVHRYPRRPGQSPVVGMRPLRHFS